MDLVKAQIPQVGLESYPVNLFFVWRQLGFAFFGALTLVGALFIFVFTGKYLNFRRKENERRNHNPFKKRFFNF